MNCASFRELTVIEQKELIQKLAHLCQTSEQMFKGLSSIVRQAENNGLLDNLKIFPDENVLTILLGQETDLKTT